MFLLISCAPNSGDTDTDGTTLNETENCNECNSILDCSFDEICEPLDLYTNPPICLTLCDKDDQNACSGKPEECIFYEDNVFVCAPQCNKKVHI